MNSSRLRKLLQPNHQHLEADAASQSSAMEGAVSSLLEMLLSELAWMFLFFVQKRSNTCERLCQREQLRPIQLMWPVQPMKTRWLLRG